VHYFIDDLLGAATLGWWPRHQARILQRAGKVDCMLRVVDGEQPGLSDSWTRGRAQLEPGQLQFTARRRHDTMQIQVVRIPQNEWRKVGAAESLKYQALLRAGHIGTAESPTARLEWAVMEAQRRWTAQTLDPHGSLQQ
jgi:hypothetical protein